MNQSKTLRQITEELMEKRGDVEENNLIKLHDIFMIEYGWIPLEEFKNLPIPTFLNLLDCIHERKEKEKQEYDKMKSKTRKR